MRVTFRAQVDTTDTIQDIDGPAVGDVSVGFDGDGDGSAGGTHDFWFQTRPLDRSISFNAGASAALEGRVVSIVGGNGVVRDFEFSSDGFIGAGRVRIPYTNASTAGDLANALSAAINSRPELGVSASANGVQLVIQGERLINIDPQLTLIDVNGKTIFVDKSAGPNADGSLANPFNNISAVGVPNAFAAAHPGDIVRIVGNGGADGDLSTIDDNFAYEIGIGLLPGSILSDGASMDVPLGVTTMVDAGAIFKLRQARIGVGSSNLNIDRSGSSLQVLGAPLLLDVEGNAVRQPDGAIAPGNVFFTSWLDEATGLDTYAPLTTPAPGDWGGISFRRDVDAAAGRNDLEDEGIFLRYVNHADIRYGGGTVLVDSIQQTVNPIQMLNTRPTVTDNVIRFGSDAAMSALPNSFEETNFHEPRFQRSGAFTSDYDRVGPDIRRNTLTNNSLNGLFIRVETPADGATQPLTVPGRLDDTDIVHLITENLFVQGSPGGAILDSTVPPAELISTGPSVGGVLLPGTYNYKVTFVDRNGYESIPSNPSASINLQANQTAISIAGLPGATGDFISRRLYRSNGSGSGPYELVATLDRSTSTFLDVGSSLGGTLDRDRADVTNVSAAALTTGTLAAGTYNYRIVMLDAGGREGVASNATVDVTVAAGGAVQLGQLPSTLAGYVGRRIYRSANDGTAPYVLVGELLDSNSIGINSFLDDGSTLGGTLAAENFGVKRPRINASLVIDPGNVIKLEGSRIEATFGANVIAEGIDGLPIVFTSKQDDTVGAGGTFDTNNNSNDTSPVPRDWGGIYAGPTSRLSVDHARFAYGGGVTKIDGTFRAFNTIEIQQADVRIANSLFENNADGFGGQGPGTRFGRLSNAQSTIFVRGSQPTIIGNTFRDNAGSTIEIDVNSMVDDVIGDGGRQTGPADRNEEYLANRGPLIRDNRLAGNEINGLEIRAGEFLTTASVWDDTDIVHVVTDEIFVGNVQHEGGLRLQSAPSESLVVKFDGYGSNFNRNMGAGLTANGQLSTGTGRVGGTIHVLGQPGFPVILTSLRDDTVGAGLQPDGRPQTDTNNDGIGSIPQAADWRGLLLDQYSNDRNVSIELETEDVNAAAPGPNSTPLTAQVLGDLASDPSASNENLRLGFNVEGVLSQSEDIDVYSFTAEAGTEVWLDVDYTKNNLDLVLELLDANGSLLARSDNSTQETIDPSLIVVSSLIDRSSVNPLPSRTVNVRTTSSGLVKEDGTTNPLDPGLRVRLPGSAGSRSTFYFRIRSASLNPNNFQAGLSSGSYQVQVRQREAQEWAGSTVNFADIRYATNGVHLRGLPGSSPLIGEAAEDEDVRSGQIFANNSTAVGDGRIDNFRFGSDQAVIGNRPQYIGNILDTDKGAISVAGNLSNSRDVDFYRLDIRQEDIVGSLFGGHASVVFDMDYADGLTRPDTSINIFREEFSPRFGTQYRLVYSGDSSNIAEDQPRPLSVTDMEDLSRGSAGTRDAYIGPVALAEGTYLVGVSSAGFQPRAKTLNPFDVTPINSIRRIVDENFGTGGASTAEPPVVQNFLPRTDVGAGGELVSATFDLGAYSAADIPAIYLDYTHGVGNFEIFVRDSSGAETLVATSNINPNVLSLQTGRNALKIPLVDIARPYDFSGQNGLSLVFRSADPSTNMNNVIIGFAERGEQVGSGNEQILLGFTTMGALQIDPTRQFSLQSYDAFFDEPSVAFDYEIFNGNVDVFVIDQFGTQTRVATSTANGAGPNEVILVGGGPQTAVVDMTQWANQPGLTVEFRTRNDNPTNVVVQDVHIQLGDGSRVFSDEPNSTYAPVPVSSNTIVTGQYQLEVRMGDEFFQSNSFGAPTLTRSFDTNDRFAEQLSIVAPEGADITAGDTFEISDGGSAIVFEFTVSGAVGLGNIPVRYTSTDPDYVVARAIRDAINNPNIQSRLRVRAATSSGVAAGTEGSDPRLNLFGNASVRTLSAANVAGELEVIAHEGAGDKNITRDQGQVLIQNSFVRESRDYGIWSEVAGRMQDPRDNLSFFDRRILQDRPALAGTQAVRNLPTANDSVSGGLLPGLVIQNNVLEEGGLGGVQIQGESPIWMITPSFLPVTDDDPTTSANGTHFGFFLDDGDRLIMDSDRTRLNFEFEDIAGGGTGGPVFGSGQVEGNGVRADSVPVYYREDGGQFYHRINAPNRTPFGTTGWETMHALRDAVLGSIFVTNGTTQQVKATISESLLGPDPDAPADSTINFFGYPEYFNRPALYLEGINNIQFLNTRGGGNPFEIQLVDLGESPQAHARLVNNTIIGKDGRASFNGESPSLETNDTIQTAVQTWQGTSHNPLSYDATGVIGDPVTGSPAQDVDIYQFKLGVGERAMIDIDSTSGLDSVIQIFDSRGILQPFQDASGLEVLLSDNAAAPGETVGLDPYVDFTATAPGVYFAAVSSVGNTTFDPLSFASRQEGTTTGAYSISLSVRHLQDFVITAQDASAYNDGDTFTIYGVPDIGSTGSSGRTFEFTFGIGASVQPGNIPINIDPDWRFPDVARAIAKAINEGDAGQPVLRNEQNLDNGRFGEASPLPPVTARALGGLAGVIDADLNDIVGDRANFLNTFADSFTLTDELGFNQLSDREVERLLNGPFREINQGLELFTRRFDGILITTTTSVNGGRPTTITTSMGNLGIGHDRDSTNPLSETSIGDGTSEKYVTVKNAAYIDGNGSILVDPDENANNNLDQLLPETGILATRGASPSILNNVFFNLQTPVINEESRRFPLTGGPAPYGTDNPNAVLKPGEVVVGGSVFQYEEPAIARMRFGTGIEQTPTNVPNTALDLNFEIADGVDLFVNAQAGIYLPSPNSPLIDSSVDTLPERANLATVKSAVGISVSPIVAPDYDLVGQLRVDDPDVAPPSGQGQNVFKDRGALDRADFEGPAAILLDPIDNDSGGSDQDNAVSVVQLEGGVYPEFRIQLADGNEPSNPFRGFGIDDNTVVNSVIEDRRLTGSAVVVFENGRLLREGIDYTFAYNATRDEIVLTPLAGVWKNDRVYEISINNKDRFAILAPAGDQVADGDTFTIADSNDGFVVYEFDSGYRIQVPQGLALNIPLAGGSFGGIADGDRFSIIDGGQTTTFEFDRNGNILSGNIAIAFEQGATQAEIADAVMAALQSSGLSLVPRRLSDGQIFIGAESGVRLDTTFTAIDQPSTTLALKIPDLGPRPGGITEGQTFTISDGRRTVTFEYDLDGSVAAGNQAIDFSGTSTAEELATVTQQALAGSVLSISPTIVASELVHIGLSPNGTANVGSSQLALLGVARTLSDGETFTVSGNASTATFEFTTDGSAAPGNVPIAIALSDTQDQIADRIAAAITNAGLGLIPNSVGDGNIAVGGSVDDRVDLSGAPALALFGTPGVQSNSRLQVFGPLLLQVPVRGASDVVDNSTFSITAGGQTVVFEFDSDFSGPSQTGNVVVRFNTLSTANDIANELVLAIASSGLAVTPVNAGGGQVGLGQIDVNQVNLGTSGLTASRGVVSDGETFTISNGTDTVVFEFENVDFGNGFAVGNSAILFSSSTSTPESVVASMKAEIEDSGLGLTATVLPGGVLELNDTPRFVIDTRGAPTLLRSGVPGGANAVFFVQDSSFDGEKMKRAIVDAINRTNDTNLIAANRGANTFFVENATSISSEIDSFFIRGVADLAGNLLKPSRINNETAFTILMPGVTLDYGDAPDPFSTTSGRYPTTHINDGARHVVGDSALLGASIDADSDGQPTPGADGDSDDGVVFGTNLNTSATFNRNIFTSIDVTLSSPGFVDGWIDFNADGDWDDPGEQIFQSEEFTAGNLTRTFQVTVPATAPVPTGSTTSYARFRSSTTGGLVPSGLAVDGEVEDYVVIIEPGTPPTAVDDTYSFNEDSSLTTTDPTGTATPNFSIDDGVIANDTDPEGGTLLADLIQGPSNAANFNWNSDGTFTYEPLPDFNGVDTFTYRVNDGLLNSNNIGTVTIIIREVNDPPVANDDDLTVDEDVVLDIDESVVLANDAKGPANEAAQTLVVSGVNPISAQGGSVSLVGGRIIYTPPSDYSGPDEFIYTISDNGTTNGVAAPLSSTATISLTVNDKNDPPIVTGESREITEDSVLTIDPSDLISNDVAGPIDEVSAGQTVTFQGVTPQSTNGGTVTFSGGVVTYTPPADFVGTDTFFYQVEDNGTSGGVLDPQQATGTVTVTINGENDPPRVETPFGEVSMQEDDPARIIDLADVFVDPDALNSGDTVTYTVLSNSSTALVTPTINNGQLTLQLGADQNGQGLIVVEARDAAGESVTDTLTLTVSPLNDAPRLVQSLPDQTVSEDANIPQLQLSPDFFFDPDVTLNNDQLTFAIVSNSNPLLVTPNISNNLLTMDLSSNQSGTASITISVTDESGQTINDSFILTVTPLNDEPVTNADSYTVRQGTTLTTTDPRGLVGDSNDDGVLANDMDPEGSALTAELVDAPQFASQFALNSDGTFTYQHDFQSGRTTDTFTYRAFDGQGRSVVTTVTLEIDEPPPPPHQNPIANLDVNVDGLVTPIDALLIINFLNFNGTTPVTGLTAPPPYRDASGDNLISAFDVLLVINALNAASGGGEGEQGGEVADPDEGAFDALSGGFAFQDVVSRTGDNAAVGVRMVERSDTMIYGPVPALSAESVFDEMATGWAEPNWVTEQDGDDASDREIPIDLALASLLGDLDEGGDA